MHVAALSGQSNIIRLLIKTIKNVQFIRRLYVNDSEEQTQKRIRFILDMYLNTPDKMVKTELIFQTNCRNLFFDFLAKRNSATSRIEIRSL